MANQIVWVDIPVIGLDRAIRFYSAVLGVPVKKEEPLGITIGVFLGGNGESGGCLFQSKGDNFPSQQGPLVYLNVQGRMDEAIAKVEPNGGKILQPKHSIEPYGLRAIILDSEGNRLALHSMQ